MADTTQDDLADKLKDAAEKVVGHKALTSKDGKDCFALPDALLGQLGAESASDGDVPVTKDGDYDWGDEVEIKDTNNYVKDIRPGYIIQFRDHTVEKWIDIDYRDGRTFRTTKPTTLVRPHHSAIVLAVHDDGTVIVAEQHVLGSHGKVVRAQIPWLLEGEKLETIKSKDKTETIRWKVKGKVWIYRPKPKKTGKLLRPQKMEPGRRMFASFLPSEGGPKRSQGPLGMETPRSRVA